jgi:ferredoxin
MIITKQKDFKEILQSVGNDPVFIIGCSECATVCHTGGEEEVVQMKKDLGAHNVPVTGHVILDPACHLLNDKRLLRPFKTELKKAKNILVLSCGNGVQTVAEIFTDKKLISGNNTLFLGEIKRISEFEKRCSMCGDCVVDYYVGLCPISRCPKQLLNGPCGGSIDGICEVNKDISCVWDLIYQRLKEQKQLDQMKTICAPKDWSQAGVMRRDIKDEDE